LTVVVGGISGKCLFFICIYKSCIFMDRMSKYREWFSEASRTLGTRRLKFSPSYMDRYGLLRIANATSEIYPGFDEAEFLRGIVSQLGVDISLPKRSVDISNCADRSNAILVDTAIRSSGGETYRLFSVMVFKSEYWMHRFVLHNSEAFPGIFLSRLAN